MQIVIKPTSICNFACTFCSSANTHIKNENLKHVPEQLKDLIKTVKPDGLIVTGGDPLIMDPHYFYELHEILGNTISITSNLKDFYLHPEKWAKLFNEKWFGVMTSFQYGEGRRWDPNTVYTEEMFIKVFNKFKEYTGQKLQFIAVIDENNEHTVLDLVKLAKRLGTVVKINNVLALGVQDTTYPRYKLYQKYFEIIDAGYGEYEHYCRNNDKVVLQCPMNTNFQCHSCIRTAHNDENGNIQYYHCDNLPDEYIEYLDYKNDTLRYKESNYPDMSDHINENCWKCEAFDLCHGCYAARIHYPPEHCSEMKKLFPRLKEMGWIPEKGLLDE